MYHSGIQNLGTILTYQLGYPLATVTNFWLEDTSQLLYGLHEGQLDLRIVSCDQYQALPLLVSVKTQDKVREWGKVYIGHTHSMKGVQYTVDLLKKKLVFQRFYNQGKAFSTLFVLSLPQPTYILQHVPNTCGFCMTSWGTIFIAVWNIHWQCELWI